MIVTLYDAGTLRCAFPYSAHAVAKIQAMPRRTYDGTSRTWLVPVSDFDLLAAAFPDLQAAVEVWDAAFPSTANRLDRTLTFCRNLAALGVSLVEQDGRIAAVGDGASPLLQAEVDEREAPIRVLLAQGWEFHAVERRTPGPDAARWLAGALDVGAGNEGAGNAAPLTDAPQPAAAPSADPLLEAVLRGMRSAAVRAAADAERRAARRRAKFGRTGAAGAGAAGSDRQDGGSWQAALLRSFTDDDQTKE